MKNKSIKRGIAAIVALVIGGIGYANRSKIKEKVDDILDR